MLDHRGLIKPDDLSQFKDKEFPEVLKSALSELQLTWMALSNK